MIRPTRQENNVHVTFGLTNSDASEIRSKGKYGGECAKYPDATENNKAFAERDAMVERCITEGIVWLPTSWSSYPYPLHTPLRLLNAPMRNKWLDVIGNSFFDYPYARAADCILHGHTRMLRYLARENHVVLNKVWAVFIEQDKIGQGCFELAMDVAAMQGHLEILQLLHDAGSSAISNSAMDWAAANGHLDVVRWLYVIRRKEGCTVNAIDEAAANGHFDIVVYLRQRGVECTTDAMDDAATNGHLRIVVYLHRKGEGCTTNAMDGAATNGHLEVLEWLHLNRREGCTADAMDGAATNGHLEVLEWLHKKRNEGGSKAAIIGAIENNHQDVVEYLLKTFEFEIDDEINEAIFNVTDGEMADVLAEKLSRNQSREFLRYAQHMKTMYGIRLKNNIAHTTINHKFKSDALEHSPQKKVRKNNTVQPTHELQALMLSSETSRDSQSDQYILPKAVRQDEERLLLHQLVANDLFPDD